MNKSGADIVLECLLEQGVDTVFGYPGGTILNIYDSIYKYSDKIRHILTRTGRGARGRRLREEYRQGRRLFCYIGTRRDQPHNRHRYSVYGLYPDSGDNL